MNITYDDGLLTFEDGSTMPAPNAIRQHIDDEEPERHVEMVLEEGPINPYETWDFLGTIVSWDKERRIGDQPGGKKREYFEEVIEDDAVWLDVWATRDGGVNSEGRGRHVGYIYVSAEKVLEEYGTLKDTPAKKVLEGELSTYSAWASGNVWGYKVYETCACCGERTRIDSCWGFYGDEAHTHMWDYLQQWVTEEQVEKAWEARFE